MDDLILSLMLVIAIISISITSFICINKRVKKIYKYLPSILLAVGSIIYCILGTIVECNNYILMLYVYVLFATLPAIIICLVIAISFDLVRSSLKKCKNTNQVP